MLTAVGLAYGFSHWEAALRHCEAQLRAETKNDE